LQLKHIIYIQIQNKINQKHRRQRYFYNAVITILSFREQQSEAMLKCLTSGQQIMPPLTDGVIHGKCPQQTTTRL